MGNRILILVMRKPSIQFTAFLLCTSFAYNTFAAVHDTLTCRVAFRRDQKTPYDNTVNFCANRSEPVEKGLYAFESKGSFPWKAAFPIDGGVAEIATSLLYQMVLQPAIGDINAKASQYSCGDFAVNILVTGQEKQTQGFSTCSFDWKYAAATITPQGVPALQPDSFSVVAGVGKLGTIQLMCSAATSLPGPCQ